MKGDCKRTFIFNRIFDILICSIYAVAFRCRSKINSGLGQGQIDYPAFLQKLEEIGYDGPVILELNSTDDLETSLARLRVPRQTA